MRKVQKKERAPPVNSPPARKKAIIVEAVSLSSSPTCLKDQRSENKGLGQPIVLTGER